MAPTSKNEAARWSLADLIDFEILLAREGEAVGNDGDRLHFIRDIRPRLTAIGDELTRRRVGLRLWSSDRCGRGNAQAPAGQAWQHGLALARLSLFCTMGLAGMGLVAGLVFGPRQAVHVIVFFGLTLALPWALFAGWTLARLLGARQRGSLRALMAFSLRLSGRDANQRAQDTRWLSALIQGRHERRAVAATLAGTAQRGAVGFNLGLILAFVGCLMLFDVRFYWEATPRAGIDTAFATLTQAVAAPWSWAWPAAVPTPDEIAATRAGLDGVQSVPVSGAAYWWPFLLMSLLVWGLLPRLLLVAFYDVLARRALARLDFQAPRHRALWRRLNAIERGEVAVGPTDGVLVLDVGGHGVTGEAVRGFLLRRLRVNPLRTHRVAVLDENEEAHAECALAAGPAGVVLLAEAWALSPRQVAALHKRLRAALGAATPMIWVIFALAGGQPQAPAPAELQRWTRQIDSLGDLATEVTAYVDGA